jgi:hypothetical protein
MDFLRDLPRPSLFQQHVETDAASMTNLALPHLFGRAALP